MVFLLASSPRYWYDAEAIRVPLSAKTRATAGVAFGRAGHQDASGRVASGNYGETATRNSLRRRPDPRGRHRPDVWPITYANTYEGHLATFPDALVEPMVLAGCPVGGTVLDPFCGSGTTCAVANRLGRHAIGIELNPAYVAMAARRTRQPGWVLETTP